MFLITCYKEKAEAFNTSAVVPGTGFEPAHLAARRLNPDGTVGIPISLTSL